MDEFPINKAHQLDRSAEVFLRQRKFEESIECYKNAMKHLHQALQMTENPVAKDSIQLQIDNHQKQIDHLKIKKCQWDDYLHHEKTLKLRRANYDLVYDDGTSLQNEIFRTMENHDSLVMELLKRDEESLKSYSTSDTEEKSTDTFDGKSYKKRQVDDSTVLEEYKVLSEKLKELVQVLLIQLDDKDHEISKLKSEITRLESEKNKGANKTNNTLKVITDSSGGTTSPFVFSPCSELSPEVDITSLPVLAPLEMPNFDFSKLNLKDTSDSNSTNNN